MILYRRQALPPKKDSDLILQNIEAEKNFRFSEHTTYGLGGRAEIAYYPKSLEETKILISHLKSVNKPFITVGAGSNILVSDKGYKGAVISTKRLNFINLSGDKIICGGGVTVGKFLKFCIEHGADGYEYLAGIPATLGGLAYMNGGIQARHIGDDIINVWFFDGKLIKLPKSLCNFGNKHSTMRDINCLICQIELPFRHASKESVQRKIKERVKERGRLPKGKSCGCVFKNPEGLSAGKLIDECNLKGASIGKAVVSEKHANFILNGGNSAQDVHDLIAYVKRDVYEKTHIELKEEVVYIGEFNDFNG